MSWVVVHLNDDADEAEIIKVLKDFKGVTSVEVQGDDPEYMLEEIGERLWGLENINNLDCPLRDMREEIEQLLDKDFKKMPKDLSRMLVRAG